MFAILVLLYFTPFFFYWVWRSFMPPLRSQYLDACAGLFPRSMGLDFLFIVSGMNELQEVFVFHGFLSLLFLFSFS